MHYVLLAQLLILLSLANGSPLVAKRIFGEACAMPIVFVSRDEDGRTRMKIIIQKRSYLDIGTETFPGENLSNNYVQAPNHRADGVLDNTAFGSNQTALPGPWTLPGKNNPWLQY